jgi:hypothetical protein
MDQRKDRDTAAEGQSVGADRGVLPGRQAPRMPHERDESARATGDRLRETPVPSERRISGAGRDVAGGLVDTDRRGVPNDVPGPRTPENH